MSRRGEFEVLAKVGIGQYVSGDSVLHVLDPRIKLILSMAMGVTLLLVSSLLVLLLLFLVILTGFGVARVRVGPSLAALKPVLPFLFLVALIQVFAVPQLREEARLLWRFRFLIVTDRSLMAGVLLVGRFSVIVIGAGLLSSTTTATQLVHGTEHLLRPLQRIGMPAHETALVVQIVFRFVPILGEELERLMKAQASRGAEMGGGKGFSLVRKYRALVPLFVPLVGSALGRGYTLVEAMEARCYMGGRGRTSLLRLRAKPADYYVLGGGFLLCGGALALSALNPDAALVSLVGSLTGWSL
jgi:energy-coupling factor transport system permease protein